MVTGMQLDSELAVGFLDFELSRGGRDAQGVVVCGLNHHFAAIVMYRGGGEKVGGQRAGCWA